MRSAGFSAASQEAQAGHEGVYTEARRWIIVASPSSRWGLGSQQPISSQAAMRAREGLARSVQLVSLYKPRSPIRPRRASSGTIFAQSGDRTRREKGGWGTWPGGTSQCASWLVALGYVAASVPRWDDFPIPACARDSALVLLPLTPAATCDSDSRRGWVFRRIMSSDLHPRSVPLHIHSLTLRTCPDHDT